MRHPSVGKMAALFQLLCSSQPSLRKASVNHRLTACLLHKCVMRRCEGHGSLVVLCHVLNTPMHCCNLCPVMRVDDEENSCLAV